MTASKKIDFSIHDLYQYLENSFSDNNDLDVIYVEDSDVSNTQTHLVFEAAVGTGSKRLKVNLYERLDGSKNLTAPSSGPLKEIGEQIIDLIYNNITTVPVKNGSHVVRGTEETQVQSFLEKVKAAGNIVEISKDDDSFFVFKVNKIKCGEVKVTFYRTNGTIMLQGASNIYFGEIVSHCIAELGHKFDEAFNSITNSVDNQSVISWNVNILESNLKSKLGSAYDQLWPHDKERLKTLQIFVDNDLNFPDYSIFVAYVGFVVEGAIKCFLVKTGMYSDEQVSRTDFKMAHPDCTKQAPFHFPQTSSVNPVLNFGLPNIYANLEGKLIECYQFLRTYRHDFSHSRKNIQLVASEADAKDNVLDALDLIRELLQ